MLKSLRPIDGRNAIDAAAHDFLRDLSERTEDYIEDFLDTGVTRAVRAWIAVKTEAAKQDKTRIPFRHAEADADHVGSFVNIFIAGWTVPEIAAYDTTEVPW